MNKGAPRIALVGTCQIVGIGEAMRALLPDAGVHLWHVTGETPDGDDEILSQLSGFDLVISQLPADSKHAVLTAPRLRAAGLNAMHQPHFIFAGMHPDITYLRDPQRAMLGGFHSDYHSIIVAAAYALGVPERRVSGLFNSYIYAELGYFEAFESARSASIALFKASGYDLERPFDEWRRRLGQFMYSQNHPHIEVMKTLAVLVLAKAGLVETDTAVPGELDDYLKDAFVWPVYPGLAKPMGLEGSTTFMRSLYGLEPGAQRQLSLQDYIAGSYAIYAAYTPDQIKTGVGIVTRACDRLSGLIAV